MVKLFDDFLKKINDLFRALFPKEKSEKQKIEEKLDKEEFWPRDKFEKESYERLKKRETQL